MTVETPVAALGIAFLGAGIGGIFMLGMIAWCWWQDRKELSELRQGRNENGPVSGAASGASEKYQR